MNVRRLFAPLRRLQLGPRDLLWAVLVVSLACAWYRPHRSLPLHTGKPYDLAILGNGYFMVHHERNNTPGLVRHGRFTTDGRGVLYYGHPRDGWVLQPEIHLAFDHQDVTVTHDGIVAYSQTDNPQHHQAGQLQLALVTSPQHLKELVPGVFQETQESGCLCITNPGTNGVGLLQQGWLEPTSDGDFDRGPGWDGTTWCLALLACGMIAVAIEMQRLRREVATQASWPIIAAARFTDQHTPAASASAQPHAATSCLDSHVGEGHLL